jgi:hypothetical protein
MDQESGLAHDSKFDCSSKKKKQLVMIIDNKPWLEVEEKQKITKKKGRKLNLAPGRDYSIINRIPYLLILSSLP